MEKRLNHIAQWLVIVALVVVPLIYPFSVSPDNQTRLRTIIDRLPAAPEFIADFFYGVVESFLISGHSPLALKEAFAQQILLLIVLIWFLIRILKSSKPRRVAISFIPVFLLILYSLISVLYADVFYTSLRTFLKFALFAFFFIALCEIKKDKAFFSKCVVALYVVSALLMAVSILQHFRIGLGFITLSDSVRNRVGSFIGHNTGLSAYLLPTFFLSISYLFAGTEKWKKWLLLLFLYVEVFVFITAQSRGVWLVLIVFTLPFVYVLARKSRYLFNAKRVSILLIQVIVVLILLTTQLVPNRFNRTSTSLTERIGQYSPDTILKGTRFRILVCSIPIIRDNLLFGVGLGGFQYVYPKYQGRYFLMHPDTVLFPTGLRTQRAHNEFLQIIVELGIVGFGLVAYGLVFFLLAGYRALRRTSEKSAWCLQFAVGIYLPAFLFHCLLDFPIHIAPIALNFCFFLAIWVCGGEIWGEKELIPEETDEKQDDRNYESVGSSPTINTSIVRGTKLGIAASAIAVTVALSSFVYCEFLADLHSAIAIGFREMIYTTENVSEQDRQLMLKTAEERFAKAAQLEPLNRKITFDQALTAYLQGRNTQAIALFHRTLEGFRFHEVYFYLAEAYYRIGDMANAKKYYLESVHYTQGYPEALRQLAEIYTEEANFTLANRYRGIIYKYNQQYFEEEFVAQGYEALDKGDFDYAISVFQTVCAAAPEEPDYLSAIALAYLRTDDLPKAEQMAGKIIDRFPDAPDGYFVLAQVHAKKGDYPNALKEIRRAASLLDIDNPLDYERLSMSIIEYLCLDKMGKEQAAQQLYHAKIKNFQDEKIQIELMAYILIDIFNDKEKGIDLLKRRAELEIPTPSTAFYYHDIARHYLEQENFEQSVFFLKKALEYNPDFKPAQQLLESLEGNE